MPLFLQVFASSFAMDTSHTQGRVEPYKLMMKSTLTRTPTPPHSHSSLKKKFVKINFFQKPSCHILMLKRTLTKDDPSLSILQNCEGGCSTALHKQFIGTIVFTKKQKKWQNKIRWKHNHSLVIVILVLQHIWWKLHSSKSNTVHRRQHPKQCDNWYVTNTDHFLLSAHCRLQADTGHRWLRDAHPVSRIISAYASEKEIYRIWGFHFKSGKA